MSRHDEWKARVVESHVSEVAKGEHDDRCEWRPTGFFLCHCSKRRREADGYTEPPGELTHQYPLCPRCDDEVDHDGNSFTCYRCHCYWPDSTGTAEFTDVYGDDLLDALDRHETSARAGDGES